MLVALHKSEVGTALVDWYTPLHFGVGAAAGFFGLNPHLASILFVGARVAKAAIEEGMGRALFQSHHGQSRGNELTDLTSEFVGLYVGSKARSLVTGEPAAAHGLGGKVVGAGARLAPSPVGRLDFSKIRVAGSASG